MRLHDSQVAAAVPTVPRAPSLVPAWLLAGIVVLGAFVRLAGLGDKSLWIDESFSVWVARQPLGTVWRLTADLDLHPPLYYTLLHHWLAVGGDSEAAARSLSALLGVLTLPVVHLIGTRIGGRSLGLVAAGLLAVSPMHVYYAQQARMYTLLTLLAAVSVLCLLHLIGPARTVPPRRPDRWWVGFAVATALAVLTHNTAVLLPVTIALFVAATHLAGRSRAVPAAPDPAPSWFRGPRGVVTGLAAALLLWLPWLPGFLSQTRRVDEEFWLPSPTLDTVLDHWLDLVALFGPEGPYRLPIVLGAAALAVLGARRLRRTPAVVLLLALLVLAPVVIELLVSVRRPIFYTQTLVWTAVPLCVLLAAGLLHLRPRPVGVAVAAVLVALDVTGVVRHAGYAGQEDWRAAAAHVAAQWRPGDVVLFNAGWTVIPFDYYTTRSGVGPFPDQHGLPVDLFERGIIEPKMTRADVPRLARLIEQRPVVWLVYSHNWYTDPQTIVAGHLSMAYDTVEVRQLNGITVHRYGSQARVAAANGTANGSQ